jgi:replicative DNA helicase
VRRNGVKLVVVDYLRLVRSKGRDLREKVGNVADGLRQLAKNENICVVLLSQLARPGDINERPTMLSLKESGDIEAHANIVLLLYMPVDNKNEPTGEDEIIIGKSREGPLGAIPVLLHKARLQFVGRVVAA